MFQLKVARSLAEIEALHSGWDALLSPGQSLFQTYRWNRLAAQVFGGRQEPYFIWAESDSGIAILPGVIDTCSKTLSFAGERLFDYRDYIAVGDPGVLYNAWRHLASLHLPISVTAVCRTDSPIWDRLPKSFFSRSPRLRREENTPEQYVRHHSRAFSRFRKLLRLGLVLKRYDGDSVRVRQIYELRAQQSFEGELFRDATRIDFMVAACRAEGKKCEIFALEDGSKLIAALITFRDRDFRRCYTTYYDRSWAHYSPGVSLLFEVSRHALEQGLSCDLMTGEQPYKVRIAPAAVDLFEVKATPLELVQALVEGSFEQAA